MPLKTKQEIIEDAIVICQRTLERELPVETLDEQDWVKIIAIVLAGKWMHMGYAVPRREI